MNHLHDLINRLRAGDSERRIAKDLKVSRPTVHKYKLWAEEQGYLDPVEPLPDAATLLAALGPAAQPPQMTSSLAEYQPFVEQLLEQGVELTAIWQRLRDNYDYQGSYSAVRRFVQHLQPRQPEAYVRVQTAPGEELQVDFGSAGQLFDPASGRLRYANAGHEPPVHVHAGHSALLPRGGIALGAVDEVDEFIADRTIRLDPDIIEWSVAGSKVGGTTRL